MQTIDECGRDRPLLYGRCDTVEYYGGRSHGNLKQAEFEDNENEP